MIALFRLVKWEVRKVFSRRRAWAGFVAILVFELVFILLLQQPDARTAAHRVFARLGYTYPDNFTGLTVAHFILGHTQALLGALFIALTASDTIASESDCGLLRMMLCRPVSRIKLLTAKFFAASFYMILIVTFTSITALGLGLLFEGPGQLLVYNPEMKVRAAYAFRDGLLLYSWAAGFQILSVLTIVALAFSLACAGLRTGTATVMTIFIFATDDILRHMPFFASFRQHFLMTHIQAWVRVYVPGSEWSWVLTEYGYLFAINAALLTAGAFLFLRRDFKP